MSDQVTFEDRVKFHYFGMGSGRVTVAYQMDNDRNSPTRSVRFGYAFCSPKDFFSKGDYKVPVYGQVFEPKYNKSVKRIVSYTEQKGGRSRAIDMLTNAPCELAVFVQENQNAVLAILEEIENFCYDAAPSWRDKATYRHLRNGNHELARDGVKLVLTKEGIELQTPWEGTIDL